MAGRRQRRSSKRRGRRTRNSNSKRGKLVREGTLFTFPDPELTAEGPPLLTNNRLEGGTIAQIRNVLRDHRGMGSMRMAKAAF